MTRGKKVCNVLKEIRQEIADKNFIEYTTSECHFDGECQGTCPKCEAELKYLENELHKRKQLGKVATIAGISTISLGMSMTTFSSCEMRPAQRLTGLAAMEEFDNEKEKDTINIDTILNKYNKIIETIPEDFILEGIVIDETDKIVPIYEKEEDTDEVLVGEVAPYDNGENDILLVPEIMPEYPGGNEARIKFLEDNLQYPKSTRNLPEGKVVVGFVVEKDGSLTNFTIQKSVHPLLDEEVIRVVKLMPKWIPGKQRGKIVRVQYTMPVTFKLE